MDFSTFVGYLKNFETDKALQFLGQFNLGDLIHNPWFLGSMGGLALVSLLMGWRALLATVVGITGLTWITSYTLEQGTELTGMANQNLLVFVGGGVAVITIVIYLLFIKSD